MSIYVAPPVAKAMLGVGAAAMQTQPMLHALSQNPHKLMRQAATWWRQDPWIRAAERVISGKFSTVAWHLEDADDVNIDDEYPNPKAQTAQRLLEQPQANLAPEDRQINASTRRDLWAITSRHMGACGNAFWYLDRLEPVAKTPLDILYVAPWRMWPSFTKTGNLTGWVLDYNEQTGAGTPLDLAEVIHFPIEPPDEGAFAPGLVESAIGQVILDRSATGHATAVLEAGGRLAGILSAKGPDSVPDDKFQQLVRDFRTISEQPDNAKRLSIVQGPVDFNRTAATLSELELIPLMAQVRDFILALWGVPLSQVGGTSPAGMNSGDIRKYDEAALWQNAIHPRLIAFQEKVQYQLLDRWKQLGLPLELEIDEPEFDDDGPRYELLQKSAGLPMRNVERRKLIGLEPFGDPVLDNAIYLPNTISQVAMAPDEEGNPVSVAELGSEGQAPLPIIATPVPQLPPSTKASLPPRAAQLHAGLTRLRGRIDREHTAQLRETLRHFLDAQKANIASRLRLNSEHVSRKPRDYDQWFLKSRWDRELTAILSRHLAPVATMVTDHIAATLPVKPAGKASVAAVDRALSHGAARVTAINDRTRNAVAAWVSKGIENGLSPADLADELEQITLDNGAALFDELRAETIARTELMDAYNSAALGSYRDAEITEVQAIDGDGDPECAERDGQTFSIEEADAIEDHPNGTLDWVPIVEATA